MKSTGNSELDAVLARYRRKKQKQAKRFAVLRCVIKVDYYDTLKQALNDMSLVPSKRRTGLVDRQTGETWCAATNYQLVKDTLEHKEFTEPDEAFRRAGVLRKLLPAKLRRNK